MSRDDIEALRADVVSAHRLIELMGEEKEKLGERVAELEQGAFSREWSNKLLVVEEQVRQLKGSLEALRTCNSGLDAAHDKLEERVSTLEQYVTEEYYKSEPLTEEPDGSQCDTCDEYSDACVCVCAVEEREGAPAEEPEKEGGA